MATEANNPQNERLVTRLVVSKGCILTRNSRHDQHLAERMSGQSRVLHLTFKRSARVDFPHLLIEPYERDIVVVKRIEVCPNTCVLTMMSGW